MLSFQKSFFTKIDIHARSGMKISNRMGFLKQELHPLGQGEKI